MSTSNKYGGVCCKCGGRVAAGVGLLVTVPPLEIGQRNSFAVEHRECPVVETKPQPTFAPTAEQQACISLFLTGESMVIEAGAGTGKTSTLRLLAESAPHRQMLYLAYNKAIVEDVNMTMPRNVRASTAHALAYQAIGKRYRARLDRGRQRRKQVAAKLGIDAPMVFKQDDGAPPKRLSEAQLAGVVMRGIKQFCATADEAPTREHFPFVEKIDIVVDGHRRDENNRLLGAELEPILERAWADILDPDGWLRYDHDYYLKRYQLLHPQLNIDVVLFDEAQDADPVIAAIVEDQQHAQRVYVGDENQQIYEWRGAVNALAGFTTEHRRKLQQSFRFGHTIAQVANDTLAMLSVPTTLRLRGHDPVASTLGELADGEADAILCRTNARAIEELMGAIRRGEQPYLVGGGKEIAAFALACIDLQTTGSTDHAELSCFDSWGEVVAFVENDEQGEELKLMVRLIETFGARKILQALDQQADESLAKPIISTAHKSKGREWGRVRIASDFLPHDDHPLEDSDYRLRYVAFTRARLHLDHTALLPKENQS